MIVFRRDGGKSAQITLTLTIEPRDDAQLISADADFPQRMAVGPNDWDAFDERAVVNEINSLIEQWWPKYELFWRITRVQVAQDTPGREPR